MEYSKLVAVTGMPGLFELINSKNDGAIVRSLEDNSTKFASSRIHNLSHLESIEVYTTGENVNLVELFYAMEKAGDALPDGKDNAILKKYFEKVYPDLDFERIYASDLKKMVKWFDILRKNKIEIKLSEPVEEEAPEEVKVEVKKEKTVKTAPPEEKKKPAAKEVKAAKENKSPKPSESAKKVPAKEAKKEKEETPKKKTPPKKK
jgi:hypothetical protein